MEQPFKDSQKTEVPLFRQYLEYWIPDFSRMTGMEAIMIQKKRLYRSDKKLWK